MKKRILTWLPLLAFFLGLQMFTNRDLVIGQPPALPRQNMDGDTFELAALAGKPAVIYFWASWCSICRAMQGSLQAVAKDHPVIGLALQSGDKEEVGQYMAEHAFHLPTVLDETGEIGKQYGIRGVPALFILGPDGKIRFATAGYTSELGLRLRLWLAARI